ncbi:MAG: hypothetical protein QOF89_4269 [Acidobacteriota bacterium]|jgi:hypothetical protein|nr:hypothetical protein [Acidobacteriota bacterium]
MTFPTTRRASSDSLEWTAPAGGFFHFLRCLFACAGGTLDPNGGH